MTLLRTVTCLYSAEHPGLCGNAQYPVRTTHRAINDELSAQDAFDQAEAQIQAIRMPTKPVKGSFPRKAMTSQMREILLVPAAPVITGVSVWSRHKEHKEGSQMNAKRFEKNRQVYAFSLLP